MPVGRSGGHNDDGDDAAAARRGLAGPSVAVLAVVEGGAAAHAAASVLPRARVDSSTCCAGWCCTGGGATSSEGPPSQRVSPPREGAAAPAPASPLELVVVMYNPVVGCQASEQAPRCGGRRLFGPCGRGAAPSSPPPWGARTRAVPQRGVLPAGFGTLVQGSGSTTIKPSTNRLWARSRFVCNCHTQLLTIDGRELRSGR